MWLGKEKKKHNLFDDFKWISVEDMIKEVDVDGDGRIDFYGKIFSLSYTLFTSCFILDQRQITDEPFAHIWFTVAISSELIATNIRFINLDPYLNKNTIKSHYSSICFQNSFTPWVNLESTRTKKTKTMIFNLQPIEIITESFLIE